MLQAGVNHSLGIVSRTVISCEIKKKKNPCFSPGETIVALLNVKGIGFNAHLWWGGEGMGGVVNMMERRRYCIFTTSRFYRGPCCLIISAL